MKTFKIEIPKGHEIDKENSTFEKIVFKEVKGRAMSWEDLEVMGGFYIDQGDSTIKSLPFSYSPLESIRNVFPTRQDAESSLALAQLLQLRKNWIGDWVADWTTRDDKFSIKRIAIRIHVIYSWDGYTELSFPSQDMAKDFLEAHKELIKTYFKL